MEGTNKIKSMSFHQLIHPLIALHKIVWKLYIKYEFKTNLAQLVHIFSNYKKICGFTNAKVVMSVNYSYLNVSTRTVGRTSVKKIWQIFSGFLKKYFFPFYILLFTSLELYYTKTLYDLWLIWPHGCNQYVLPSLKAKSI